MPCWHFNTYSIDNNAHRQTQTTGVTVILLKGHNIVHVCFKNFQSLFPAPKVKKKRGKGHSSKLDSKFFLTKQPFGSGQFKINKSKLQHIPISFTPIIWPTHTYTLTGYPVITLISLELIRIGLLQYRLTTPGIGDRSIGTYSLAESRIIIICRV